MSVGLRAAAVRLERSAPTPGGLRRLGKKSGRHPSRRGPRHCARVRNAHRQRHQGGRHPGGLVNAGSAPSAGGLSALRRVGLAAIASRMGRMAGRPLPTGDQHCCQKRCHGFHHFRRESVWEEGSAKEITGLSVGRSTISCRSAAKVQFGGSPLRQTSRQGRSRRSSYQQCWPPSGKPPFCRRAAGTLKAMAAPM